MLVPDLEEEEVEHDKEGSYHEPAAKKFVDIAVDIVKRKKSASKVVFSEATVPIETFAYHKLMGPESSGRGDDVEENQRNNTPLVGEPIRDSLEATPTLAKNNEVYIKDGGQIENTTVLRDKGGAAHTSRSPHVLNQPNSLQGVNKSCTTQIGKKHISATNGMETSTIGMPRRHNFVNQLKCIQGVSKGDRLTSTPSPLSRELMSSKLFDHHDPLTT
ncbi:hypothetical protein Cgig2_024305 [Carnegiea gigantea]|uniref:Uncharacterized protein n=1 Tax=Carnegiea gigantea TaxID=171969 RepID=A0A9Q1JNB2_9CARY|nr:hypothetical protein Cgig2_024305 [Carnegiea gigantea]